MFIQEPKIWIGLDVSKLSINYAVIKTNKNNSFTDCRFTNGSISNDLKGYADLEHFLMKFKKSELALICETTGVYNIPICNYFLKKGYYVVEEHARNIKHFAIAMCNRGKTDELDAQLICFYGHLKNPSPKFAKFDEILELERKVKLRDVLKKQAQQFGGLTESFEFPYHAVGFELNEKAPASILLNQQLVAETALNLKNMEKEVNGYVKLKFKDTYENLLTIPQVGEITASVIIANTMNFKKFDNEKQFINYCGLVPRPYESGTSVNGKKKIPFKFQCDVEVRTALYNTVSGAISMLRTGKCKNKGLQSAYNALPTHIKTEKGIGGKSHHKHIYIVLSRQLAKQIFVCGKYGRQYQANPAQAA